MYSTKTLAACMCAAFAASGCHNVDTDALEESALGGANAAVSPGLSTWQPSQFYPAGRLIQRDNQMFVSVVDTQSSVPISDSKDWVLATGITQSDESALIHGTSFGLIWRGEWVVGQAYEVAEVVSYDGQSYVSKTTTTGLESPDDTAFWDLLARRGDRGEAGLRGAVGPQGEAGSVGTTGEKGNDGAAGLRGLTGATGAVGATGVAGAVGATGATGATGVAGVAGAVGATGATGVAGAVGATGAVGAVGATGVAGVAGVAGAVGATGATGVAGAVGAVGATGAVGAVGVAGAVGATGATGVAGAVGATGVAGATGAVGATGDIGATGAQGIQGVTGARGDTGDSGSAGIQGVQGVQGLAGVQGDKGDTGDTGDAGIAGAVGTQGIQGVAGDKGEPGNVGPEGAAGLVWEGNWSILGGYVIGEAVSYNGSAYIAIQDTPAGTLPTDTVYWDVLAAAGVDGSSGGTGSDSAHYKVAGITSTIFAGNAGLRTLNAACKTQYGDTARMANSLEVALYPPLAAVSGMVWIQGISHPSDVSIDKTSGLDLGASASNLTCNSWSSTSGNGMVVLGQNFSFNQNGSCANSQAVLCAVEDGVEQEYEFAGFTTTTMSGNGGYLNMANACRADVGSTARVATTAEVMQSNLDTTYSGKAWVQGIAHDANPDTDSVSGISVGVGANLTCSGWSDSSSNEGLVLDGSSYSISAQACYIQSPVACSEPK